MPRLSIVHLYADLLKTYGDRGNVLTLRNRAAWRGWDAEVVAVGVGERLPEGASVIFLGGGSDRIQGVVVPDLERRRDELAAALSAGAVVLSVCGGYQLMGNSYETAEGAVLAGLGLLDVETRAGEGRLIGNVVAEASPAGPALELVGFENHGGRTFLGPGAEPLAMVVRGHGNNGADRTEGAIQGRVIGTYLHGPVLPLNPGLTDWLLALALGVEGSESLPPLEHSLEDEAHQAQARRARRWRRRRPRAGRRDLASPAPPAQ